MSGDRQCSVVYCVETNCIVLYLSGNRLCSVVSGDILHSVVSLDRHTV